MKTFEILCSGIFVFFAAVSTGCGSLGETERSGEQVTVVIGPSVLAHPEKVEALREYKGVEYMHTYLRNYIRSGGVRPSIEVHITITEFRLGWGRDSMGIEVLVSEQGKELKRFRFADSTDRDKQVKRLTKELAKRTYDEIRR